jgi:hypothetical protein
MHDPVGDAYWGSVGKMFDDQVTRAKAALRLRFPDDAAAAGDTAALEQQAHDRMLPRGGSTPGANDETLTSWAARLKAAWDTWEGAGSAKGLLLQLKAQGFPMGTGYSGTQIFNHLGRIYALDGSDNLNITRLVSNCQTRTDKTGAIPTVRLGGFTLDARDQFYSCFCIIFMQDVPSLTNDANSTAKTILNQTVNRWRQSGARYVGAAVVPLANSAKVWGWPATVTWGDTGLKWGDNGARFIDADPVGGGMFDGSGSNPIFGLGPSRLLLPAQVAYNNLMG